MFADFYNVISRNVKYADNKESYIYNLTKTRDKCKRSTSKFDYIDGKILKYIVISDINRKKILKKRKNKLSKQKTKNSNYDIEQDNIKDVAKEIKSFDTEETILEKVIENDNIIIEELEKDINKEVDISNDINEIIFCREKKCYINIQYLIEILDNIIYQFKKMLAGGDIIERKKIQRKSKYLSIAITALVSISLIPIKIFLPLIGTGIAFTVSTIIYNLSTVIFKQIAFSKDVTSRFLTNDVIRLVDDYMKQRFKIFENYFREKDIITEYTNITSYFVFLKVLDFDKFLFDYCKGKTKESLISKKKLLIQQLKDMRDKIKHTFIKRIKSVVFRITNNRKYIRYIINLDNLINYLEDPKYDELEILREFYTYIYISNNTIKTTFNNSFNIDDNIKKELEILKDNPEILSLQKNIFENIHDIPYIDLIKKQTYLTNIIALKSLIIKLMMEQTNILSNYGKRILEIIDTFNSFKKNLEKLDVKQIELDELCVELTSTKSNSKYSKFIRDLFGNLDNVFPEPDELYV